MSIIECQKVCFENSLSTTQCSVLSHEKGRAYGCQNLFSTAQSTECRHEKGAGPIVVKTSLAFALSRKCVA